MGENAIAVWETVKRVLLFDKVVNRFTSYLDLIPQSVINFYNENRVLCLMIAICALALIAFEGYKLFKMALYVVSGSAFAFLAYYYLGGIATQYLGGVIPAMIDVKILVAVVGGLIALFLTRFSYNFMLMILGGVCGYFFGYIYVWRVIRDFFNTLQFLKDDMARYIIGGVFAAIAALLFILIFKHVFMVGTSFGCLIGAGIILRRLMIPTADDTIKISVIILAIALGIFAVVHQYKEEEKALELVF